LNFHDIISMVVRGMGTIQLDSVVDLNPYSRIFLSWTQQHSLGGMTIHIQLRWGICSCCMLFSCNFSVVWLLLFHFSTFTLLVEWQRGILYSGGLYSSFPAVRSGAL